MLHRDILKIRPKTPFSWSGEILNINLNIKYTLPDDTSECGGRLIEEDRRFVNNISIEYFRNRWFFYFLVSTDYNIIT